MHIKPQNCCCQRAVFSSSIVQKVAAHTTDELLVFRVGVLGRCEMQGRKDGIESVIRRNNGDVGDRVGILWRKKQHMAESAMSG